MKRVLMIQGAYFPWVGGAEIFMQYIAENLANEEKVIVDIVTCKWKSPKIDYPNWQKNFEQINGVNVYRVNTIKIPYLQTLAAILPLYKKAKKLLQKNNYDFVHAHIYPAMTVGALLKLNYKKLNLFTTVQGGDLADYKENIGVFGFILKPLISWSLKKADLVHAVSKATEKRARFLGAKKTVIIPNGVDTERFFPIPEETILKNSREEKVILSVSRLTPKNGLKDLIKAFAEVTKEMEKVRLVIIGSGDEERELKKLICSLNLEEKIELRGSIANSELNKIYNSAHIFCRPSIDEGFGISFIEAMAAGTPVIGSRVGGIVDIIKENSNGLMIEAGDILSLKNALLKLLKDEKLREKLSMEGLKTVKENYLWRVIIQSVKNKLYKNASAKQ